MTLIIIKRVVYQIYETQACKQKKDAAPDHTLSLFHIF